MAVWRVEMRVVLKGERKVEKMVVKTVVWRVDMKAVWRVEMMAA